MYGYHGFFYGRVLGVADCISLASPRRAKLAHSIAPPLQRKPASLGFALGGAYGGHCGRIGVHPTRTLCHGWSEPGAAVKPYRIKFYTAPGPSGPEGIKTRNRTLRAGNFAEGRRGILRKWGSGGGPAGAVRRPRDTPGGVLPPLPPRAKEVASQGETLQGAARRVVAPYGRHGPRRAGGAETAPTTSPANHSKTGQQEGKPRLSERKNGGPSGPPFAAPLILRRSYSNKQAVRRASRSPLRWGRRQ